MSEQRKELIDFANFMEKVLKENDWKGGWQKMNISSLVIRAKEELTELEGIAIEGIANSLSIPFEIRMKALQKECADVANFMMMLYDNINRLRE